MLGAGPKPADEQRKHQQPEPRARAGKTVADAGKRGAERKDGCRAQPLG